MADRMPAICLYGDSCSPRHPVRAASRPSVSSVELAIAHYCVNDLDVQRGGLQFSLRYVRLRLGISEETVKVHRGHVMRKMEADSLADLVRMSERLGIPHRKNP
jgi:hypothetical protein